MSAFKYLNKFADPKLMNRISRSEFHLDWMRYFSRAFYNLRRIGHGLFAHCGNVENPDILVIVADFFTRVHNVPWVVSPARRTTSSSASCAATVCGATWAKWPRP